MSTISRALNFDSAPAAARASLTQWEADRFGSRTGFEAPDFVSPRVACWLDGDLLPRFLTRVPGALVVTSIEELLELAVADCIQLLVADPATNNGRSAQRLVQLRRAHPTVEIVVYTMLRASVMPSVVLLAQHGVQDVVIYGTDDSKARFDELIERSAATLLTSAVLRLLNSKLDQLPRPLGAAVREMFDSPRRFGSVHQLAAASGVTRRSLYRHCAAVGLRSPRLLVASARVVRAAHVLAHSDASVREVARSLGFSKPDILTLQVMSLTGLRPRELRDSRVLAILPNLLASRLCSE